MAKLSSNLIRLPEQSTRTFTLTIGGQSDEITFRKLRPGAVLRATEEAETLFAYHMGTGVKGMDGYAPAVEPLPPVDGEPVQASQAVFKLACYLDYAQVRDGGERYSVKEFVLLMVDPGVLAVLSEAAGWCLAGTEDDDEGNPPSGD